MEPTPATSVLTPLGPGGPAVPPPDPDAEPAAFMVESDDGTRLHFLDWGEPGAAPAPGVLLIHGVAGTAWAWAPVARRLASLAHVVAPDLRGHGLSDAPPDGYDLDTLAGDALAVAEGAGLLPGGVGVRVEGVDANGAGAGAHARGAPGSPRAGGVVVAGHGFGAAVAAACAARLGRVCAGLVLVDGGWDDSDQIAGTTLDEWLRSVEEPPEVLRTMAAFLEDRESYDPATWDADQERAARAAVVELPAGRVASSARRHAVERVGESLLAYDPAARLATVAAPIIVLAARDDEEGTRTVALVRAGSAVVAAGRMPPRYRRFPAEGHNLMRYRPDDVAGAILALLVEAPPGP